MATNYGFDFKKNLYIYNYVVSFEIFNIKNF